MTKTVPSMHVIQGEEWSALYVDGKLAHIGDSYLADEKIRQIAGVTQLDEGEFWDSVHHYEDAPQTLEGAFELIHPAPKVNADGKTAQELREEAQRLIAEADKLS